MDEDTTWMNLAAMVGEGEMYDALLDVYSVGGGADPTIAMMKRHIDTVMGLIDALKASNLPSGKLEVTPSQCQKVYSKAIAGVRGQWAPLKFYGWVPFMACVVALRVLTDYDGDETLEEDTFLGRVNSIRDFAERENHDLQTSFDNREKRDAAAVDRPVVPHKTSDIGNTKKWGAVRDYFFNRWSDSVLKTCLKTIDEILDPHGRTSKTVGHVKRTIASIPARNLSGQSSDDSVARAKALIEGDDDSDDGFNLSVPYDMPRVEGKRGRRDPDCMHCGGYGIVKGEDCWYCVGGIDSGVAEHHKDDGSCTHSEESVDMGDKVKDHKPVPPPPPPPPPPTSKRARAEPDRTIEEEDEKRARFRTLRDAAVLATIAYGEALHSIQDAGPRLHRNIAWAAAEISWQVRERLTDVAPTSGSSGSSGSSSARP